MMDRVKTLSLLVVCGVALSGLRAEALPLFPIDNAFSDIANPEEQATLLQELGYAGICTRPASFTPELARAMDQRDLAVLASYVVLNGEDLCTTGKLADAILTHFRALKGRKTIIWFALAQPRDLSLEDAAQAASIVADAAQANGLPAVLYPHVGFRTATVKDCLEIVQAAKHPNLGLSFTLCHFLKQNDVSRLEATLKAAAPYLKLVQVNGANRQFTGKGWEDLIKPLGEGDFDMAHLLSLLEESGFRGPVNLQCYSLKQPAREHLTQSMQAWKQLTNNRPRD